MTRAAEVLAFAFDDWQGALPAPRGLDELRLDAEFLEWSEGAVVAEVRPTQSAAIDAARTIAKNQATELLVHGRNGQIRERDSFGNDPFPPRG